MLGMCTATGEIDTASARAFSAELHEAIDGSSEARVSVDCSGVTFMGSSGYRALVDATEYAAGRGHTLVIRNMSSSCARLFRVFGENDDLTFESSPEHLTSRQSDCARFAPR